MEKSKILEGLKESTSRINFNEIKTDVLKEVLFLVSPDLELLEVANACALDQTEIFKTWLDKNLIRRPTENELQYWKENNTSFDCTIVKPFMFLQKPSLN